MDGSEQFETYVGEALQSHMQSQHIEVLEAEVARLREALEVLWGAYIGTGIEDDQPYVFCEHCLEPAPASAQLQHMDNCPFAALSTPADDSCEQWRFNDLIAAVTREQGASDE